MPEARLLVGNEEPGVVFSVKELIGRLDGKIDVVLQTLTGKADRTDLAILGDRVGRVENSVAELHEREREREATRLAAKKAREDADAAQVQEKTDHREARRWVVGTIVATAAALAAVVLAIVAFMGH